MASASSGSFQGTGYRAYTRFTLFTTLPLEVILEVCSWLNPQALLQLARTSKDFRQLLMKKSCSSVWKQVLENDYDLPRICLDGISLPAMVSLAYDNYCRACGHCTVDTYPCFQLRTRMCDPCVERTLFDLDGLESEEMHEVASNCLRKEWFEAGTFCLLEEMDELFAEYNSPRCNREALIARRSNERKALEEMTEPWEACDALIRDKRHMEVAAIKTERSNSIMKRLTDLGYGSWLAYLAEQDEILDYPSTRDVYLFHDHPLVRMARPLTERGWWRIEGTMVDYMERVKKYATVKREVDREELNAGVALLLYRRHACSLPTDRLIPTPADLFEWQPCKKLIQQATDPEDEDLTGRFEELFVDQLDGFIADFEMEKLHDLVRVDARNKYPLKEDLPPTMQYLQKLKLATTTFRCTNSDVHDAIDPLHPWLQHLPMWYPEPLHHVCTSVCARADALEELSLEEWKLDCHEELVLHRDNECYRRKTWSAETLEFDEKAQDTVERVIRACKLDPANTTVAQMDAWNTRFVCLECPTKHGSDGEKIYIPRSWRHAVGHALKKHPDSLTKIQWYVVPKKAAARARRLEKVIRPDRFNRLPKIRNDIWRCRQCQLTTGDPGRLTLYEMVDHYVEKHGHQYGEIKEEDYYKAPDAPPLPLYEVEIALTDVPEPHIAQSNS